MTELPRVAVLMGGPSTEHDISLKSGRGVVEALARRHWAAEAVEIPRTRSVEEACTIVKTELKRLGADVAFIALHGTFGEDGTIQQLCQQLHIAYTGSTAAASRLGMDKAASRKRFEKNLGVFQKTQIIICICNHNSHGRNFSLVKSGKNFWS